MHWVKSTTFDEWRDVARELLARSIHPSVVSFEEHSPQRGLFDAVSRDNDDWKECLPGFLEKAASRVRVPKQFLELARIVACHRAADRYNLLYRILWRLTHGEAHLLEMVTDDDIHRAFRMEKAVKRDAHKMEAFVRFRHVTDDGHDAFIAWHRPDHRVLRLTAPFFSRRFPAMHWTILTPDESVVWDKRQLTYGPGVAASAQPAADELERMWRAYYAATFNPARINVKAMKREMPVRHWKTLPETQQIPAMLADAPRRVADMVARQEGFAQSAADFLPRTNDYSALRSAAECCAGCHLHATATQTVFGEGPVPARVMLVGEQPGDQEDLEGRPFIGPAGEILNEALSEAGLDRSEVYITNAVKHFKYQYVPRGKRRLHKKPDSRELAACQPWLQAEIGLVRPDVIVCLGVTAAQSLIGPGFRIAQQRGEFLSTRWCEHTLATYHPSAALRAPDDERRAAIMKMLVRDLRFVSDYLSRTTSEREGALPHLQSIHSN